jgi:ubiquinone biosynthesis monooxygenase Coq6
MKVWDGITGADIHLDSALLSNYGGKEIEKNTIAYIVENINVQSAALKRIDECRANGSHIDMFQKVKVAEIKRAIPGKEEPVADKDGLDLQDWPTIHLDNGKSLKARLLVSLLLLLLLLLVSS